MLTKLEPDRYDRILPLLAGTEHNLSTFAVVDQTAPGAIWTDDPSHPATAIVASPEGHYLVGDPASAGAAQRVVAWIREDLWPRATAEKWLEVRLHVHPERWATMLEPLLADLEPLCDYQRYFVLESLRFDWRAALPSGFELRPVSAEIMAGPLRNAYYPRRWAEISFHNVERFLQHGFGFCISDNSAIATWCMSDCVRGDRCEIGIHTNLAYRRRGLGACVVAAAAEHCLARGIRHVGWHCWSANIASARLAQKVGFAWQRDHQALVLYLHPADARLVRGNVALIAGDYPQAAQWYARAFEAAQDDGRDSLLMREPSDRMLYRMQAACAAAMAGDRDAAQRWLDAGIALSSYRQGGS